MDTATPINMRLLPNGLATDTTGVVAWWKLSGNVDHTALSEAWARKGLDADWLPSLPSAKVALTRAVDDMISNKATRKKVHVADAHWMVYDVHTSETLGGSSMTEELHAKLTDDRTGIIVTPAGHPMEAELLDNWRENQTRMESRDIGAWLPKLLNDKLHTVPLIGGPTFIMPAEVGPFRKIKAALTETGPSYRIGEMQAVRDDEAVQEVLDSLLLQAQAEVDTTEAALDADEFTGKGFRSAHKRCDAMLDKVEAYEKLLEKSLDDIRAKLSGLAAASAEAAIVADDRAAAERAAKKTEND